MARVKRWIPSWQSTVASPWPWEVQVFALTALEPIVIGDTLLRTHVSLSLQVFAEDDATSAYPAPWRNITTSVAIVWTLDGPPALGFYSQPNQDFLFVGQVRWDISSYIVNPIDTQVRGTWSKNTIDTGQIDSHSQRIATTGSAGTYLLVDPLGNDPAHPEQFTPYIDCLSRTLVESAF